MVLENILGDGTAAAHLVLVERRVRRRQHGVLTRAQIDARRRHGVDELGKAARLWALKSSDGLGDRAVTAHPGVRRTPRQQRDPGNGKPPQR